MNRSEIRENCYCVTYTYIQPHPPCAPWHTGSSLGTIHILRQQRTDRGGGLKMASFADVKSVFMLTYVVGGSEKTKIMVR